jgi:hypothetical protein
MVQPAEQRGAVEPVGNREEGASGNAGSQQGDPGEGDDSGGQGGGQGVGRPAAAGRGLAAGLPGRLLLGFTAGSGQRAGGASTGLMCAPVLRRMRDRQRPAQGDGSDQQAEQNGRGSLGGRCGVGAHPAKIRGPEP